MKIAAALGIVFLMLGVCSAQTKESPPAKFYRLDFVVKEVEDGKLINARSYSTLMSTDARAGKPSLRTGSKVPVRTGGGDSWTYIDLGINFDCRFIEEVGRSLALDVTAEVSSSPATETENSSVHLGGVIRQNRWSSSVAVVIGKPATIFSSDDLTTKRKMQVELTATPIAP